MTRRAGLASVVAAALGLLATGMAQGQGVRRPPPDPFGKALAGGYQLATRDGGRRCLILLRPEEAGRLPVGFPPPCRRSFPVLDGIRFWRAEAADGPASLKVILTGGAGEERLVFALASKGGHLESAGGSEGAAYTLTPAAGAAPAARAGTALGLRDDQRRAQVPSIPNDRGLMVQQAGAFHLLRLNDRDTGCVLVLEAGQAGDGIARLQPGCGDRGVTFFAPSGWRITAGTLWLVSPRGKLSFERNRKGHWTKGPGQGEALSLVRKP